MCANNQTGHVILKPFTRKTLSSRIQPPAADLNHFSIWSDPMAHRRSITVNPSRINPTLFSINPHKAKVNNALSSLRVAWVKCSYRCAQTLDMCGFAHVCCCNDPTDTDSLLLVETAVAFGLLCSAAPLQTREKKKLLNQGPPPCFLPQLLTLSPPVLLSL